MTGGTGGGKDFVALPLKFARSGMKLEQNVLDQSGRMVIAPGTRLTPMLLSRLQKWNIKEIYVRAEEAEAALRGEAEGGESAGEEKANAPVLPPGTVAARTTVIGEVSEAGVKAAAAAEHELEERFAGMDERPLMKMLHEVALRILTKPDAARIPGRK